MDAANHGLDVVESPMNDRVQRKTAVSIQGLVKRYSDNTFANHGIDLDVFEGEVLSILGPNGAGKPR